MAAVDSPPQLADGAIDPLGVLTLADRMPGCIAERLGHDDFAALRADLVLTLTSSSRCAPNGSWPTTAPAGELMDGRPLKACSGTRTGLSWPTPPR